MARVVPALVIVSIAVLAGCGGSSETTLTAQAVGRALRAHGLQVVLRNPTQEPVGPTAGNDALLDALQARDGDHLRAVIGETRRDGVVAIVYDTVASRRQVHPDDSNAMIVVQAGPKAPPPASAFRGTLFEVANVVVYSPPRVRATVAAAVAELRGR